jgi:hypothetical protein
MRVLLALSLAAAIPACVHDDDPAVTSQQPELAAFKAVPDRDLDLLFVVDNSDSMADKQASLVANFPQMMAVLSTLPGGLPNLHIGVVTSDMGTYGAATGVSSAPIGIVGNGGCANRGDGGALQTGSAGSALAGNFISDIDNGDGTRARNYTGSLAEVFSQIATVGTTGCGFEQHLESMKQGLVNPQNTGFLRDDANLAVIVLADEDDCSVADSAFFAANSDALGPMLSFRCTRFGITCDQDLDGVGDKTNCRPDDSSAYLSNVSAYTDFLIQLKGDPRKVMIAGITGPNTPVGVISQMLPGFAAPALELQHSCGFVEPDGTTAVADPAVRLQSWIDNFPGRAQWATVCQQDLTGPLQAIGGTARKLVGETCFDGSVGELVDTSGAAGLQPECTVFDVRDSAPDAQVALPSCAQDASGDCYDLVADPVSCPASQGNLKVVPRRASAPAADTWTHVSCTVSSTTAS